MTPNSTEERVALVRDAMKFPGKYLDSPNQGHPDWQARAVIEALTRTDNDVSGLVEALERIAGHTNPDDPESYRSDDREGCLDTVQSIAVAALAKHRQSNGGAE